MSEEQGATPAELGKLAAAAEKKGWAVKGGKPPKARRRTGAAAICRDYMRRHPGKIVTGGELQVLLQSRIPGVAGNAASSFLWTAAKSGEIHRSGREFWYGRKRPGAKANGAADAVAAEAAIVAKALVAGLSSPTGDAAVDADMQELDAALAALGRIETLVRKYRDVGKQLAALKSLLAVG